MSLKRRGILSVVGRVAYGLAICMHVRCLAGSRLLALAAVLAAIPPVLDSIVAAVVHHASDLRPLLSDLPDLILDELAFDVVDGVMVEVWLQILVPSLTTLLGGSGLQDFGYLYPLASTLLTHQVSQSLVFSVTPGSPLLGWGR